MSWTRSSCSPSERVKFLQAQLFPVCTLTAQGYISEFLAKSLKTTQIEVNVDEKGIKPIARLRDPRDLFALPKVGDYECTKQAARWPIECQVLDERIYHIATFPCFPEPYNKPTGNELKPRPVGEENGIVVFNYNPVSAVNYRSADSDGSNTDHSSGESRTPSPKTFQKKKIFTKKFIRNRSSSSSDVADSDDTDEDDKFIEDSFNIKRKIRKKPITKEMTNKKKIRQATGDDNEKDKDYPNYTVEDLIKKFEAKETPKKSLQKEKINQKISAARLPKKSKSQSVNKDTDKCGDNPDSVTPPSAQQTPAPSPPPPPADDKTETTKHSHSNDVDIPQFSRSSFRGAKFLTNCHPNSSDMVDVMGGKDLVFESRFECGNLAKAVKITPTYYELYLRPDLYTNRHRQWFYFRVSRTNNNLIYRFSIVNLMKSDSLYNDGMRPLMYSTTNARRRKIGWVRCGENISYFRNSDTPCYDDEDDTAYTLTFNIKFDHDNDTVYFAHSYPYGYSELQDYLFSIQKDPVKSRFCKLRLLCKSLAGNNVYYLTVTAQTNDPEAVKKKRAIVVSARVHPGETPSSWMMKGFMDYITGDTNIAKRLRHKFIFKLIPMLNPDGVIVGNTRSSLTGKDLNRQYRTVIRETYPTIYYTKAMIKRLVDEVGVAMYCDMHAHSRRHNIFVYGCENRKIADRRLCEQIFPLMVHKNCSEKFSFEDCRFKVHRNKEGTGRIVIWMLGVMNSYTVEASFGGSSLGSRNRTHFSISDYESMGKQLCETLLDYYDERPSKEQLRQKIIGRLFKEGSTADCPMNISLSDYSSDEGERSNVSSDDDRHPKTLSDLEGMCCRAVHMPLLSPDGKYGFTNILDERKFLLRIFSRIITRNIKLSKRMKQIEDETEGFIEKKCYIDFLNFRKAVLGEKLGKNEKSLLEKKKKRKKRAHIKKNLTRTIFDLPVNNPGSDAQFSTEDEMFYEQKNLNEKPLSHHHLHRSNQLIKSNSNCNRRQDEYIKQPDEILVTSFNKPKAHSAGLQSYASKHRTSISSEFPVIGNKTEVQQNRIDSRMVIPKIRYQCLSTDSVVSSTKINSKKKWNGPFEETDRQRPYSWGMPSVQDITKKDIFVKDTASNPTKLCMVQDNKLISKDQIKKKSSLLLPPSKNAKMNFNLKNDASEQFSIKKRKSYNIDKRNSKIYLNKLSKKKSESKTSNDVGDETFHDCHSNETIRKVVTSPLTNITKRNKMRISEIVAKVAASVQNKARNNINNNNNDDEIKRTQINAQNFSNNWQKAQSITFIKRVKSRIKKKKT